MVSDRCMDETDSVVAEFPGAINVPTDGGTAGLARNAGLPWASGDWIAFLDDDDVFLPEKFERIFRALSAEDAAEFVYSDAYLSPDAGRSDVRWGLAGIGLASLIASVPAPSTWMVRRNVFERVGAFDGRFPRAEERDFVIRAWLAGVRFMGVPLALTSYRTRPPNLEVVQGTWRDMQAVLTLHRPAITKAMGRVPFARAKLQLSGWNALAVHHAARAQGMGRIAAVRAAWSVSPFHTVRHIRRLV